MLSYLNPFQAHVAYFEARSSCYSASTIGNPQRKSSAVRYRWTPAAVQQDDGVIQSEQKISKLDYVLSEPACRYPSQPFLSYLMSLHQAKLIFSFALAISPQPAGCWLLWITTCLNETHSYVCSGRYHLPTANPLKVAYLPLVVGTILPSQIHSKEVARVF